MNNPIPAKGTLKKIAGKPFYYIGRTLFPSKAKYEAEQLKRAGLGVAITKRRDAGFLIYATKPIFVDLTEPIYGNPGSAWHRKRVARLMDLRNTPGLSEIAQDRYNERSAENSFLAHESARLGMHNPLVNVDKCPTCHRKRGEKHIATTKSPSVRTMEKWMDSGIARATDGCKVEPDGVCPHGHQSWIRRLGLI